MTEASMRPLLRVVRGDANAEETAALVAALAITRVAARQAAGRAGPRSGRADARAMSGWCDRSRLLPAPVPHGPGGWRASARPR